MSKKVPKPSKNPHEGSSFADFLQEEGIATEVTALASKRLAALEIQEILKINKITKTVLAERMKTSRSAVDRLLNPNKSMTLNSLEKVAKALNKTVQITFVDIPAPESASRKITIPAKV